MTNANIKKFPMTATFRAFSFRPMEVTKSMALNDPDYPYVSKCRKKSRDLLFTLSDGVTETPWSDKELLDGQFEDVSRCSDYSSCSDLCSSPESTTEGFHVRASFNTLPNHHDLLSPFSPFVRQGQYECRQTTNDCISHRKTPAIRASARVKDSIAESSAGENYSSQLSSFEVSYKRLVVDYTGDSGHDDKKYFHPIKDANDADNDVISGSDTRAIDETSSLPGFVSQSNRCSPRKTTITSPSVGPLRTKGSGSTVDVAKSMIDLFSKDTPCALIKSAGVSTVAIDNKIEQAMDLVKSHLMYAVREEVEVLKEQIKELIEKNQQLEMENAYLKSNATPDLLKQLQAHVESSPTPPPVVAPPVASNLPSTIATPSNTTALGAGQFSTQNVTSQTGGVGTTGVAASSSSAAVVNVTHAIGPTGSNCQIVSGSTIPANASAPPGGGAYSSSSPNNP